MKKCKNLFLRIFISDLFLIFCFACQQETDNSDLVLIQKITNQILDARSTNIIIPPITKTNGNLSLENANAVQVKLSDE